MAVIFANITENGETKSQGLCIKCAKELGLPVDNMLGGVFGKFGLDPEQVEEMEENMSEMIAENDDGSENIDGIAPAIDFQKLVSRSAAENEKKKEKKGQEAQKKRKYLDTYCRNLTKKAKDGELDRIVGRERELQRVIQILCRRQKNNPCLIGEPGVGKTAIAEALAQKIASDDVPYKL
ncbi:MAG: ATP-dependent Clp protease ATP-binding subunit, partial [Eubacteriales bacterium]